MDEPVRLRGITCAIGQSLTGRITARSSLSANNEPLRKGGEPWASNKDPNLALNRRSRKDPVPSPRLPPNQHREARSRSAETRSGRFTAPWRHAGPITPPGFVRRTTSTPPFRARSRGLHGLDDEAEGRRWQLYCCDWAGPLATNGQFRCRGRAGPHGSHTKWVVDTGERCRDCGRVLVRPTLTRVDTIGVRRPVSGREGRVLPWKQKRRAMN